MNRRTSVYTLSTPDAPGLLDRLREACPVQVSESLVSEGMAKLRFRQEGGDTSARMTALMIFDALGVPELPPYTLRTGVGISAREVALS